MNQENIDYLKKELKKFGFGEKLNEGLVSSIKEEPATFQLVHKGEFKHENEIRNVDFVLNFKKSDQKDMYFFNSYIATLQSENPDYVKTQTFYTKGDSITAKEAFNLLEGRTINKDIIGLKNNKFNAWRQLDFDAEKNKYGNYEFKQWHENYGYNLEQAVSKFPIKELSNEEDKAKLLKSLEKGDLKEVTFLSEGNEQKMYISANPQFKSLNVFDANMKSVYTNAVIEHLEDGNKKKETQETAKAKTDEVQPAKRAKKAVKI